MKPFPTSGYKLSILEMNSIFGFGLLQRKWIPGFTITLQKTPCINDSMNIPKIEFIVYIYILL